MATYWHKPAYTAEDRDPVTHDILPGAMPPGIYCEDEAAYRALLAKGEARADLGHYSMYDGGPDEDRPLGWMAHTLHGIRIRVATPAEADILRATPATFPAEHLARQRAAFDAVAAQVDRLVGRIGQAPAPPGRVTRQQRRAAERAGRRA